MRLIAKTSHHHIVQFAAHFAIRTQRGGSVDFGAHVHVGVFASGKRGSYAAALHHLGIFAYVDGAVGNIQESPFNRSAFFDENLWRTVVENRIANHGVGAAERLRLAALGDSQEVGKQLFAVFEEYVVDESNLVGAEIHHHRRGDVAFAVVVLRASECDYRFFARSGIVVAQSFAHVKLGNQVGKLSGGQYVRGNEQVVACGFCREFV